MRYWIVGKWIDCECKKAWEFAGIYDTEEKAIKACEEDNYFIGPTPMNSSMPDVSIVWPGAYYPLREEKTNE